MPKMFPKPSTTRSRGPGNGRGISPSSRHGKRFSTCGEDLGTRDFPWGRDKISLATNGASAHVAYCDYFSILVRKQMVESYKSTVSS
ncbi:hypothetical protein TIFTF001_015849 [Ficus carica]|uniref:Uncharacterized protein n=1 Tax=Ficus carica TaxID=3494 RepID=A0AA88AIG4_FICCA|nr:hypothetical protein TIFTF001_015849 [Ficus carica]